MVDLERIEGFDWDDGNIYKSDKHGVSSSEAEQIFINEPLLLLMDEKHSKKESRYHALGKTSNEKILHITFTLRDNDTKIRVISARTAHKKERVIYAQKTKIDT